MKIAIVGPGGIGCLFAGLLSQGGHDVWLVDRHADRAHLLDRRGIWISGVSGEFRSPVRATAQPRDVGPADLVLISVKSYDTAGAALTAQPLIAAEGTVLTLQNGLGNLELLQRMLGAERVIAGVTSQAATLIAPGQVHHAGLGMTIVGEPSGELSERLTAIEAALSEARIQVELTTQLASVLWGKLVVNAGINAVATLAQVRNGGIMESASLRQVLRSAVSEVEQVAKARQIRLPQPDMVLHAEEICQRTANNLNSMLQDYYRQRRTEVDAINGAVVREGAAAGVPTPTNRALADLIRGLEETYAARVAH
jgi:2-dehydropantoate 2-reductase